MKGDAGHGRSSCQHLTSGSSSQTVADARRIVEVLRQAYNTRVALQLLGYVAPEEFEQLSSNGACGKQQAEPEGGTVLDASSAQG